MDNWIFDVTNMADSKPSTSKSMANSEENISPNRQASKRVSLYPSMQEENSLGDEPSPPKAVKKSPEKLAKKSIEKSPDDSKPSTSKSRANSEENISPNRQASKRVQENVKFFGCGSVQFETGTGNSTLENVLYEKLPEGYPKTPIDLSIEESLEEAQLIFDFK